MGEKKRLIVTVEDEAMSSMNAVVDELKRTGFGVEQVLEFTGNVVGTWSGEPSELKKVQGVLDAEYEGRKYTQS